MCADELSPRFRSFSFEGSRIIIIFDYYRAHVIWFISSPSFTFDICRCRCDSEITNDAFFVVYIYRRCPIIRQSIRDYPQSFAHTDAFTIARNFFLRSRARVYTVKEAESILRGSILRSFLKARSRSLILSAIRPRNPILPDAPS